MVLPSPPPPEGTLLGCEYHRSLLKLNLSVFVNYCRRLLSHCPLIQVASQDAVTEEDFVVAANRLQIPKKRSHQDTD